MGVLKQVDATREKHTYFNYEDGASGAKDENEEEEEDPERAQSRRARRRRRTRIVLIWTRRSTSKEKFKTKSGDEGEHEKGTRRSARRVP